MAARRTDDCCRARELNLAALARGLERLIVGPASVSLRHGNSAERAKQLILSIMGDLDFLSAESNLLMIVSSLNPPKMGWNKRHGLSLQVKKGRVLGFTNRGFYCFKNLTNITLF